MKILRTVLILALAAFAIWLLWPLSRGIMHIGMLYPLPIIAVLMFIIAFPQKITYCFHHFKMVSIIVTSIVAIGVVIVASIFSVMVYYSNIKPKSGDTVVVLGCEVQGTIPSRMLNDRINAAFEFLKENQSSKCVASGGKGAGEQISEAQAIKTYLVKKGISEDRIFLEDTSVNTLQNISNSIEVINKNNLNKRMAITTDSFHQFRASFFAGRYGAKSSAICCETATYLAPSYWARELLAVVKALVFKG